MGHTRRVAVSASAPSAPLLLRAHRFQRLVYSFTVITLKPDPAEGLISTGSPAPLVRPRGRERTSNQPSAQRRLRAAHGTHPP